MLERREEFCWRCKLFSAANQPLGADPAVPRSKFPTDPEPVGQGAEANVWRGPDQE